MYCLALMPVAFFNDPAFLRNLSYFHTERRSSKLSLDKKAYARISELISEIDKEIKDYQSKDKHLLRALLYETLMLLNRLYSNSNALPPDTNARSKSIYVDRFIELVNHSFKQDHSIRSVFHDLIQVVRGDAKPIGIAPDGMILLEGMVY